MAKTLHQMVDEVREGLRDKLRMRGPTLDAQVRKAGRMLPRGVRRDAAYLAQAVAFAANPKRARMVDVAQATRAHRNVMRFLEGYDLGAQRRTAALNIVASIAFALLVTGLLVLFVLVQRGFV